MNVFLAGAAGVVGRRLAPMLRDAGHAVTGTTRSPERVRALETLGVRAVLVDVYDARALLRAMAQAYPDVVIHQLTDLPAALGPQGGRPAEFEANARLRIEGTRNLMAAAEVAGARRVVAQSIAFAYAPGEGTRVESDPLDLEGPRARTAQAVAELERQVQGAPGLEGLVLRYGRFYGAGTWYSERPAPPALHADAAARAALLAVTRGAAGVYNVAEDSPGAPGAVSSEKAVRELGFDAAFRLS